MASPAPGTIPATLASVASAKSMLGSGSARRCASADHGPGHRQPRRVGGVLGRSPRSSSSGPRVAGLVHEVAEARDPLAAAEQVADHARRVGRAGGRAEHDLGAQRGPAVQGAADGARGRWPRPRTGRPGPRRPPGRPAWRRPARGRPAAPARSAPRRAGPRGSGPGHSVRVSRPAIGPARSPRPGCRGRPAAGSRPCRRSARARPPITADRSRCRRSGSVAARAGTMTWSRSSGSVPAGSAAWAAAPGGQRLRRGQPAGRVVRRRAHRSTAGSRPPRSSRCRASSIDVVAAITELVTGDLGQRGLDDQLGAGRARAAGGPCGPAARSRSASNRLSRPPASRRAGRARPRLT